MSKVIIIAIDTDTGKTIATGLIAKNLKLIENNITTMKLAQTGCEGISEDIVRHRQLMGIDLLDIDKSKLTCPYIFKMAASPHLAASLEGSTIFTNHLNNTINKLESSYNITIIEGIGGLMVPLNTDYLLADFIQEQSLKAILVTSSKIGSLNHTFLTLEALKNRDINLIGIVYNHFPQTNSFILNDTRQQIKNRSKYLYPNSLWAEMSNISIKDSIDLMPSSMDWYQAIVAN